MWHLFGIFFLYDYLMTYKEYAIKSLIGFSQCVVTRPRFGRARNRVPFSGTPAMGPIQLFIQWAPEAPLIHGALCVPGSAVAPSTPLVGDKCKCVEICLLQKAVLLTSRNGYVAHWNAFCFTFWKLGHVMITKGVLGS
jgi:hypothetical protein